MTLVDAQPTLNSLTPQDVSGCTTPRWLGDAAGSIVAADAVVVTEDLTQVLMIRRAKPPFDRVWAFPGGKADASDVNRDGELDLGVTADRELAEETGVVASVAVRRHQLADHRSATWDPRFVSAHVGAVVYVVPPDISFAAADDASAAQWVGIDDLASGREVLAFEHAYWLAAATAPDGPLADPTRHEAFTALALAARVRSARLITKVNAVRRAASLPLIDVDWTAAHQDKEALRGLAQRGVVHARLEPVTLTVADRQPIRVPGR